MNGWTLAEIIVNLYQGWLIVYFMGKVLTPQRGTPWSDLSCALAIGVWYTLYLYLDVPVTDTVVFILPFLYCLWSCEDRWYHILFWDVALAIIFSGCTSLNLAFFLGVLGGDRGRLMGDTPLRAAFLVSTNLMLLIAVLTVGKLGSRKSAVPWVAFVPLLLLNFLCLAAVELVFTVGMAHDLGAAFTSICLCLFGISLLSIVLYEVFTAIGRRQRQYELEIARLTVTEQYNQEMQNLYADIAVFRHDLKHQIELITQLARQQHSDDLQNYVADINERLQALHPFATGNQAVDALLAAKASVMRQQRIAFDFEACPLDPLPIPASDFCAILGNLLDNAIEGIGRMAAEGTDKAISLSFARAWGMFYIQCQNPCDAGTVKLVHGTLISSKRSAGHGIGTRSIRSIVERNHGSVSFRQSEGLFTAKIALPVAQKEADK